MSKKRKVYAAAFKVKVVDRDNCSSGFRLHKFPGVNPVNLEVLSTTVFLTVLQTHFAPEVAHGARTRLLGPKKRRDRISGLTGLKSGIRSEGVHVQNDQSPQVPNGFRGCGAFMPPSHGKQQLTFLREWFDGIVTAMNNNSPWVAGEASLRILNVWVPENR